MFLTKERDYAVRIIRTLADMELKTVKDICDQEHIPRPFAYKIIKKLEHSGLVVSRRGPSGGYSLVKKPEELTLLDIVVCIEGDQLLLNECLHPRDDCINNRDGKHCGVHLELKRAQEVLIKTLQEKKIIELI